MVIGFLSYFNIIKKRFELGMFIPCELSRSSIYSSITNFKKKLKNINYNNAKIFRPTG